MKEKKALQPTIGFTQAGVYARRQFCADLEVYRPPEPLWNPRLREAATTLSASGGLHSETPTRQNCMGSKKGIFALRITRTNENL